MRKKSIGLCWAILLFQSGAVLSQVEQKVSYPYAEKTDVVDTLYGTVVTDPFRYLENPDDPRTIIFNKAQDELVLRLKRSFGNEGFLQNRLEVKNYADFKPLTKQGKYYFHLERTLESASALYYRTEPRELPKLAMSPKPYNLSKNDVASLEGFRLSGNNQYIAGLISHSGSDWREIRVMDLVSKKSLPDQIKGVRFSSVYWKNDGFFYCRYDDSKPNAPIKNRRLFYHVLGTDQAFDKLIYEVPYEWDAYFDFEVSHDQANLYLYTVMGFKDKIFKVIQVKNLNDSSANYFKPLITWPYSSKVAYEIIFQDGNDVYALTDLSGFNNSILKFDLTNPNKATTVVPIADSKLIRAKIINRKIVCEYTNLIKTAIAVYDLNGGLLKTWGIPPEASIVSMHADPDDTKLIYSFESFYYPASFYTLDMNTLERKPISKTGVFYSIDEIMTEFIEYPSSDGTLIPMYITYNKYKVKHNGKSPCLLIGYGGFGASMRPHFDPTYQVLYDNGCIVAAPCIRGGGERDGWHEQGKNLNRKNAFQDFISAGEYLIKNHYTNPSLLASNGGSNGGLLVTVAMLKRPELFKAVIADGALLDMLRYHKFTGASLWQEEYGTVFDEAEFRNLLSYSPLHNVKSETDYPSLLFTVGENDDRVPTLHALKMVATLQASESNRNLYLLYNQLKSGHTGSEILSKELEKEAFKLAFLFQHWGMKKKLNQGY